MKTWQEIYKEPDWLYKPAVDDGITSELKSELISYLICLTGKSLYEFTGVFYATMDIEAMYAKCLLLRNYLKNLNLDEHLYNVSYTLLLPNSNKAPVHVDFPYDIRNGIALTIPLINCENTFNVWYDTDILYHKFLDMCYLNDVITSETAVVDESNIKELSRIEAKNSCWVNIMKPHNTIVNHNNMSLQISLRFTPALYEMIADNRFEKLIK